MSKISKSTEEWRSQLTPEQYRVTREAGTEYPGTGEYELTMEPGTYHCICCDKALFDHSGKFISGCGWPSFHSELEEAGIEQRFDASHGMRRTELVCADCEAHLGHLFNDGPPPTGQRYCINSASLRFRPEGKDELNEGV